MRSIVFILLLLVAASQASYSGCDINPCLHGGTCIDYPGGDYECYCTPNYLGATCSETANNVCTSTTCQNGGTCTNGEENTYTCSCLGGWSGTNCQTGPLLCSLHPCLNGGTCYCSGGDCLLGTSCLCAPGFSGPLCIL